MVPIGPVVDMNERQTNEKEFVDSMTEQAMHVIGSNVPVKRIRHSHILSALLGAIGFSLFVDGVSKLAINIPAWMNFIIGLILMAATGLLLRNLYR